MVSPTESVISSEAAAQIAYLRSPRAIRDRCQQLFDLACRDRLPHFRCDLSQLEATADYVLHVTRQTYPDLNVPFHSRWRHFEGGDRLAFLAEQLAPFSPVEQAQAKFDLAIISVLLDAGSGPAWHYTEPRSGQVYTRSEGLAVASFWMMAQGLFSSQPDRPWQADAIALQHLTTEQLGSGLQVTDTNPLLGLAGRTTLLNQLGHCLTQNPQLFGAESPRPGNLVPYLVSQAVDGKLAAATVLAAVLTGFGPIWPSRIQLHGVNLGDVWPHSALATADPSVFSSLVPFHKLSQWLTYSLLEPLAELGLHITDLDALTGLPEYRNGGLCLDMGLLQVKDPAILQVPHPPSSEVIVEWRSLTVILLDAIATTLRQQLGQSAIDLPLVKVLQGGTWAAGRQLAAQRRQGLPPLQIDSDGTVF